jgi:uncharacterized membrane protein
MDKQSNRIQFLDFMRGFAVVVMVMGHSIDSVLSPAARATEAFRLYDAFRGFTAPMFLFVSGFAFMVATANRWDAFRSFSKPMVKRLAKIGLLFVIGYALHVPYFSYTKLMHDVTPEQLQMFLQADILHCVAFSLLVLQLVLFVMPTRVSFVYMMLSIVAFLVLASPLVWRIDFAPILSPVLSPYMNQTQQSLFPVFPFAAYLFSGVIVGHFFLLARDAGKERAFVGRMLLLSAGILVAGYVLDKLPINLYPPHDFWKTSPLWFLMRVAIVMLASVAFYFLRRLPQPVECNLIRLGQASLVVYPLHLVVAYGSAANPGLMQLVGQTLAAHHAIGVGVAVLLSMLMLTYFWTYVRKNHLVPARLVQAGLTGTLLYTFVTRPW